MSYTSTQLKKIRKQRRMSQTEVAKKLNVSGATVCSWEKGTRKPSSKHIKKICKVYQVSPNDILYPKKEQELTGCNAVEEYMDALAEKLNTEELLQLAMRIMEGHKKEMAAIAFEIIENDEENKKAYRSRLLKELIEV